MVAFLWRTRATPWLHVSTLSETIEDVVRRCSEAASLEICLIGFTIGRSDVTGMSGSVESPFLRVLSFAEVIHTEVGPPGPVPHSGETGFFTWPRSFLEPTGFAASRAGRRWTTPLFPYTTLSPRISIANMAQRT